MRVDCYNASECPLTSLDYGDTFYLDGVLYIKLGIADVDVVADYPGRCFIASLDKGELKSVKDDIAVILADTKVIINVKDAI
jgi:hypothetical protein